MIFKRIFGVDSNKRIIRAFVSDLLDLPLESVRSVSIENVEIAPETEGDLMAIEQTTTIPEVTEAIVQLRRLSADEKARQEAWYREKQLLDEASIRDGERRQGFEEGHNQGFEEGVLKTLVRLVRNGTLTLAQGAKEADMTPAEFEKLMESTP